MYSSKNSRSIGMWFIQRPWIIRSLGLYKSIVQHISMFNEYKVVISYIPSNTLSIILLILYKTTDYDTRAERLASVLSKSGSYRQNLQLRRALFIQIVQSS